MNLLRDIERRIDEKLRKLFGSAPFHTQGRELVEIQRMILDRIDDRVQHLPRGRRVFPYNQVAVRIPLAEPERRAAFETIFVADDALREEIIEHLRRDQVELPPGLSVEVQVIEATELTEPSLVFRNREEPRPSASAGLSTVRLTTESGSAMEVRKARVQIGRTPEVLDDRRRLVRRNDIVLDSDTVSRAHAHIEFASGEFRIFDDGSSYGTSVLHQGRLVEVPQAGGRGMRLEAGDEIYFGQTRVVFEIL